MLAVVIGVAPTRLMDIGDDGAVPVSCMVSDSETPANSGVIGVEFTILTSVIQLGKFVPATEKEFIVWLPVLAMVTVPVRTTDEPQAKLVVPKLILGDNV